MVANACWHGIGEHYRRGWWDSKCTDSDDDTPTWRWEPATHKARDGKSHISFELQDKIKDTNMKKGHQRDYSGTIMLRDQWYDNALYNRSTTRE